MKLITGIIKKRWYSMADTDKVAPQKSKKTLRSRILDREELKNMTKPSSADTLMMLFIGGWVSLKIANWQGVLEEYYRQSACRSFALIILPATFLLLYIYFTFMFYGNIHSFCSENYKLEEEKEKATRKNACKLVFYIWIVRFIEVTIQSRLNGQICTRESILMYWLHESVFPGLVWAVLFASWYFFAYRIALAQKNRSTGEMGKETVYETAKNAENRGREMQKELPNIDNINV